MGVDRQRVRRVGCRIRGVARDRRRQWAETSLVERDDAGVRDGDRQVVQIEGRRRDPESEVEDGAAAEAPKSADELPSIVTLTLPLSDAGVRETSPNCRSQHGRPAP